MQSINKTNPVLDPSPALARKIDEIAAKLDQLFGADAANHFNTSQHFLLNQTEICAHSGLSRQQISNMIARGEFPAPVQLVGRRRAWRLADFKAWISSRPLVGGEGNAWNGGPINEKA